MTPTATDQKMAGFALAAHRTYWNGASMNCMGAIADVCRRVGFDESSGSFTADCRYVEMTPWRL